MAELKSVVKDTAIYGLSSIIGRFLNYLLVPLYTAVLPAGSGGYGVVTNIYAYVGLILVILTFGMETTFFRFANKEGEKPLVVYSTTLIIVGTISLFFLCMVLGFLPQISQAMGYATHPEYIGIMGACVALDAFLAIPFAWLRYQKRPIKFAALNLLFIFLNIVTNLLYFLVLPKLYPLYPDVIGLFYNPGVGVGYIFGLNLVCKAAIVAFFIPELTGFKYILDVALMKRMLRYSWPILVLGIAGILNQTADKIIFPLVYGDIQEGQVQLGIYGACVKIAMIMAMITQAFRYAYEPFVFGKSKDQDSKTTYAKGMKFFIIFTLLAFLCVMAWLDALKYIIAPGYWDGLRVVPIVMAAEIMMGIYFNLSFWYKLIDKTIWGAWFSLAGCAVLLVINFVFIPRYGYMACAWGGFAGYGTSMILSYLVGQKKNPINYPMRSIMTYIALALLLTLVMVYIPENWNIWARLGAKTILVILFAAYIVKKDFPLKSLPVIGKYFK
ncbi:lipopolysaccharide biosynthesis protein [Bacteroides sp. OF04-15BH]|jgi:O-antigen/teichoic acid export membrane protein|uniref:oligosaccharide flippase family protein n=1 Tax=Bacteroides sp. OF04-15BH TaxID=2292281 RepID=UPI000E4DC157|nr:lipopolysaccharide biosynthesis protein [Bacteroides sp. OF04-15BH]RHP65514.1 lipopolysaccharide biosynthesis protein [Bacteroides sp. OF04-15BH]